MGAIALWTHGDYIHSRMCPVKHTCLKTAMCCLFLQIYIEYLLKKPGSAGCEELPPVILQGHTDIVAVKLPESDHDWLKDQLPLSVEGGCLRSRGTTLGADNGRPHIHCHNIFLCK